MPTRKSPTLTVVPLPVQIALDRGDHEMHAAILPPGGTRPVQEIFKTGAETLHGFIRRWQQAHPGHVLEIAFEQPAPGLLHALMDLPGVELYPMNPSQTARYREVLNSSRKKDDATDALVIPGVAQDPPPTFSQMGTGESLDPAAAAFGRRPAQSRR